MGILGLTLASLLNCEFVRVTRSALHDLSAAKSADGIRALLDPIIVLSTPGLFFLHSTIAADKKAGLALTIASVCAVMLLLGSVLLLFGIGFSHTSVQDRKD